MKIAFSPPDISDAEINEVVKTLKSGWITTGPKTKLFEEKITEYTNASRTVCMNSSTAAMEITLRVLGISKGDEVITTAYTFTATASVIKHVGATIKLIDTKKGTYHMDYEQLEKAITPKTKAVIAVDIAGIMCDYDKVFGIVNQKRNLFTPSNELQNAYNRIIVIADAAHSFGARYRGMNSGEVADFTCFSFHAVKNLTTAEGGAVTWKEFPNIDKEWLYQKYMLLILHGQSKDALAKMKHGAWEYDILDTGYKANMTDISASIGLAQLNRYSQILNKRKQIIQKYDDALKNYDVTVLQHYGEDYSSSGHLYMVNLNGRDETYRNNIIDRMSRLEIATNVHYKPLPMLTVYKKLGFDINDYPNSFHMYKSEITLPLHNLLTDNEITYVMESFCTSIENN